MVNGMQDLLTPPSHSARRSSGWCPGAEHVVVEDAGHIIMLEHPDVVNEQLARARRARHARRRAGRRGRAQAARAAHRHRPRQAAPGGARRPVAVPPSRPPQRVTPDQRPTSSRRQPAVLATAEDTRAWGARLGGLLRAGDLVVLTGDLGAGKTTLTQGIGRGPRGPRTDHVPDLRHRPGPPVARRGPGARPRRRLPPGRVRRARRPRPRRLPRGLGHRRRVGPRARRGPGRRPPRGDPRRRGRRAAPWAGLARRAGGRAGRRARDSSGRLDRRCCCSPSTPRPLPSPSRCTASPDRAHGVGPRRAGAHRARRTARRSACLAPAGRDAARRHRRRRRQRSRPVHRPAGRHRHGARLRPRPRHPGARRLQPRRPGAVTSPAAAWRGRLRSSRPTPGARRSTGRGMPSRPVSRRRLTDPAVDRRRDLPDEVRQLPDRGARAGALPRPVPQPCGSSTSSAGSLGLARAAAPGGWRRRMPVEPLYLRRPDALTTAERADAVRPTCGGPTSTPARGAGARALPRRRLVEPDLVGRARRPAAPRLRRRGGRRRGRSSATPASTSVVRWPTS